MRWIDFEDKTPVDPINTWAGWSAEKWQSWLDKSSKLHRQLKELHQEGKLKARNKLIDNNSKHWGELKGWLFALSHGKCWFTEGRDICSHKDVEHFRPKKEAKNLDGSERDGYWWLAFDYSNFRAAGNIPNRKKGGWFPLHKDSRSSCFDARCEESETPYLIDPTDQDDVNLLAVNEEGNVIPAPEANEWEQERVNLSIERLKLNEHDALSNERRKVWQEVDRLIDSYHRAKARMSAANPAPREKAKAAARRIKAMTQYSAELSSVALWCVRFRLQ